MRDSIFPPFILKKLPKLIICPNPDRIVSSDRKRCNITWLDIIRRTKGFPFQSINSPNSEACTKED
jgi:hypothetical protein